MDWQQRYLDGDTPWDKGYATPVLSRLIAGKPDYFGGNQKILVPGCGLGHDCIEIAKQGAQVTGLDIAPSAISMARQLHEDQHLHISQLNYQLGDLFAPPVSMLTAYDLIWEHTCFCAIDPSKRPEYVQAVSQLLAPSGMLLGVFFLNPDMPPNEGPPFAVSREEILTLFQASYDLLWEQQPTQSHPGREGRELIMCFQKR